MHQEAVRQEARRKIGGRQNDRMSDTHTLLIGFDGSPTNLLKRGMTCKSTQKGIINVVGSSHRISLAVVPVVLPGQIRLHGLPSNRDKHAPHFSVHRDLKTEMERFETDGHLIGKNGYCLCRPIIPT